MTKEELKSKALNKLFKNQGIYNGLIGVGLLYSVFLTSNPIEISRLLLVYIILVALYGSITSDKKNYSNSRRFSHFSTYFNIFFKKTKSTVN